MKMDEPNVDTEVVWLAKMRNAISDVFNNLNSDEMIPWGLAFSLANLHDLHHECRYGQVYDRLQSPTPQETR